MIFKNEENLTANVGLRLEAPGRSELPQLRRRRRNSGLGGALNFQVASRTLHRDQIDGSRGR